MNKYLLKCPVCSESLNMVTSGGAPSSISCKNGHSFDFSKDGYVNLLLGSKSGDKTGDSKFSARSRHEFLSNGYYSCLKEKITSLMKGTVLDICCGEGYYDDYAGQIYGFDISKEMVRLASKRYKDENHHYFVANISNIPISDASIDTAIHLFAPFNENEFSRILKDDGVLYSVIPGANHLFEMKKIVYPSPYKNDEKPPLAEGDKLKLISTESVSNTVSIGKDDLKTLFSMTPYFYRTSDEDRKKLDAVDTINLTVEFVILKYVKR